jgi:hypothetical protein
LKKKRKKTTKTKERRRRRIKNRLTYFVDSSGFLDLLLSKFLAKRARDSPVGFVFLDSGSLFVSN